MQDNETRCDEHDYIFLGQEVDTETYEQDLVTNSYACKNCRDNYTDIYFIFDD